MSSHPLGKPPSHAPGYRASLRRYAAGEQAFPLHTAPSDGRPEAVLRQGCGNLAVVRPRKHQQGRSAGHEFAMRQPNSDSRQHNSSGDSRFEIGVFRSGSHGTIYYSRLRGRRRVLEFLGLSQVQAQLLSDSHSTGSSAQSPEPTAPKRVRKAAARRDPQARREQNRNAQRAFRDRRERRMYELESRCDNLESLVKQMREANARLQQTVSSLRMENTRLRTSRSSISEPSGSPPQSAAHTMPAPIDGLSEPLFAEPLTSGW